MVKKLQDMFSKIENFAIEMMKVWEKSPELQDWEGKDKWWYFSQIAISLREVENLLQDTKIKNSDLRKTVTKIALLSMIVLELTVVEKQIKK